MSIVAFSGIGEGTVDQQVGQRFAIVAYGGDRSCKCAARMGGIAREEPGVARLREETRAGRGVMSLSCGRQRLQPTGALLDAPLFDKRHRCTAKRRKLLG